MSFDRSFNLLTSVRGESDARAVRGASGNTMTRPRYGKLIEQNSTNKFSVARFGHFHVFGSFVQSADVSFVSFDHWQQSCDVSRLGVLRQRTTDVTNDRKTRK